MLAPNTERNFTGAQLEFPTIFFSQKFDVCTALDLSAGAHSRGKLALPDARVLSRVTICVTA